MVSIVSARDGNLWFTDIAGYIGRITTAGVITEYANGLPAPTTPYGLTLGPDGNLWFADVSSNSIGKFVF